MERKQTKSKKSKFLLKCARIQREHWFWSLVLVKLSALWFSLIVTYMGNGIGLTTVNEGTKTLTVFGWISTLFITGLIILGECSLKYEGVAYNSRVFESGYNVLTQLNTGLSNACKEKRTILMGEIDDIKTGRDLKPVRIVSDPFNQLKVLTNEIIECLRKFLQENIGKKWRYRDLYVSIVYEFSDEHDGWHWATEERGLSLEGLLTESEDGCVSALQHLITITQNNVFFNSKEDAKNEKHYIPDELDEYDEDGKLLGSIACFERYLKKSDKNYIHYILSISSYSQRFTNDNSKEAVANTKHNMREMIINDFLERIDIELCLLCLDSLSNHRE